MSNKKPYFPFFMDISNAKGVIIGGGRQAYEKIQRMHPYGAALTVIASEFLPEIENIEGITLIRREFDLSDFMPEPDFVVVALDNEEEKKIISKYCKTRRIPVNVVDDESNSSYIYSAMVTKGSLSIGISTGGASPAAASVLKDEISEWLPEQMEEILDWLEEIRPSIKESISDKKKRKNVLRKLVKTMLKKGRVLTEEEMNDIISPLSSSKAINDRFLFRDILPEEADRAVLIEQICFPPNEACSEKHMKERIAAAPELFLVAVDKESGKVAGFLNGLSTDEESFRDEFFTDVTLYNPEGKNVMLLGLDVLPEYRGQGLAREIVYEYMRREQAKGRKALLLTCLDAKVEMYQKFGFVDEGIANSTWGGEEWHEMIHTLL